MNQKWGKKGASQRGALFYKTLDKIFVVSIFSLVAIFILYPIVCVLMASVRPDGAWDMAAYRGIVGNKSHLIINSLKVAFPVAVLSTFLALHVALYVRFLKGRRKMMFVGGLLISMVSPPFISALSYIQLFGRRGIITHDFLGLDVNPYGLAGVILMESVFYTSLNALLLINMLSRIDVNLLLASLDLGVSRSKTVIKVLLPLIRPSVFVCFLLSFIRSLADFGTPVVIGGSLETVATEIYMQMIGYGNLSKAAALNVCLMVPAFLVFSAYRRLMNRNAEIFGGTMNKIAGNEDFVMDGASQVVTHILADGFLCYIILEYGMIFIGGFSKKVRGKRAFTDVYFRKVVLENQDTLVRSLCYALVVACLGTLLGILFSYYVDRRKVKGSNLFDLIVTLPYMLPGSCFGIGYILAFNKGPIVLTGTGAIVVLNMIFKQLSLTTKAGAATFMQIGRDVDDAARDLGASRIETFKDVLLPNMKTGFVTGFVNNFSSAMTTVGAIIFLVSPGKKIAVFALFDSINSGRYGEASMISTWIILVSAAVNGLSAKIVLKKEKKHVSRIEEFK